MDLGSTTHVNQLFVTINDLAKVMDEKLQVDVAILDFSKAFDKVAHSRLLYKFVEGSYTIGYSGTTYLD